MKLIKEFTRQCCSALRGVSRWNEAISEVVEVVPHKVSASVCGQCRTISQKKYRIGLVVPPGRTLAAMRGSRMCKGCAYMRLWRVPDHQCCAIYLFLFWEVHTEDILIC